MGKPKSVKEVNKDGLKQAVAKTIEQDRPYRNGGRSYFTCVFVSYKNIKFPRFRITTLSGTSGLRVCQTYIESSPGVFIYSAAVKESSKKEKFVLIAKRKFSTRGPRNPTLPVRAAGADSHRLSRFIKSRFIWKPSEYLDVVSDSACYRDGNFINEWEEDDITQVLETDTGKDLLDLNGDACPTLEDSYPELEIDIKSEKIANFNWTRKGVTEFLAQENRPILGQKKRAVNGKGTFVCPTCNKKFSTAPHLKRHQEIHKKEGDFKCTKRGCKYSNRLKSKTTAHEKTHATHEFVCKTCWTRFVRKDGLTQHTRVHHAASAPKYTCELCSISFNYKGNWENHNRAHHVT